MTDAGPVFVVAGVVFAFVMAWAIWVNVRPLPPWKVADTSQPVDDKRPDVST